MLFCKKKKKTNTNYQAKKINTLNNLRKGQTAVIVDVNNNVNQDNEFYKRLLELGFIEGETVKVIAESFPQHDPIVVKIGNSCFACRRYELSNIQVTVS